MKVYIYKASLLCNECGEKLRRELQGQGLAPKDPDNEYSYDSDSFPKGPMYCGESDNVEHCMNQEACVNALKLDNGTLIGTWLENELTTEGRQRLMEYIALGGELSKLWANWYNVDITPFQEEGEDEVASL
jgi:hypothetical protein